MQMDIYERESYVYSISNLVMLKAFYDAGVDITKIGVKDYFVDVQGYSIDCSMDILMGGLSSLFSNTEMLTYDELDSHDTYKAIFEDGTPESAIIVSNSKIKELITSKLADKFIHSLNAAKLGVSYADVDFVTIKETKEIGVQVWFPGALHEVAIALIKIFEQANKLYQILECEKENGISDNDNRQVA